MRDHLLREALIECEGMTPHTALVIGDGSHRRPARIDLMTGAAREHLDAFWPSLIGFDVQRVIEVYLGYIAQVLLITQPDALAPDVHRKLGMPTGKAVDG